MTMKNDWNSAGHVLCVQLGRIDDVLTCTPALRALRAQCPGRKLSLLASCAGAALGPCLPDVDAVLPFEAPWMGELAAASPACQRESLAALAAQGFDAAVIFTCHRESALPAALLCQLAGIPLRAAWCHERPYGLLTHPAPDPEPGAMLRHPVQRQLDLVARLGAASADERLAFAPPPARIAAVRTRLLALGIDPAGRWLALHPGAGAMARRYSQQYWRSVLDTLHARAACPLVLVGGAHEQALVEAIGIAPGERVHSLAGQLDIGELGALLAQASLALSNNAGTIHLAAAVGTPVVSLGAADPRHTPWRVPGRVLGDEVGSGERHGLLETPAPAQVADAVCSLLRQTEACRAGEALPE